MDAVVLTPKAAHFARLDAVIKCENALGSFLIKGIDREEDEGDEDGMMKVLRSTKMLSPRSKWRRSATS
jgi:hypothetical protein